MKSPNPHKRRAMEEENDLDMEYCSTSRLVTPSPSAPLEGNRTNLTPKAKSRYQPANPFNCPKMIDEDIPDIEGPPDDHLSIEDECVIK